MTGPGEMFMLAEPTILVDEYESMLAETFKIGTPLRQPTLLVTFAGRVNNGTDRMTVTVAMQPETAAALVGHLLDELDTFAKSRNTDQEGTAT